MVNHYTHTHTCLLIHMWSRMYIYIPGTGPSCCSGFPVAVARVPGTQRHGIGRKWNWEHGRQGISTCIFLGPCPEIRSLQGINLYGLGHLVISRYSCSFERNPCGSTAGKTLASVGPTSRQTGLIDLCLTWRVQPELTSGLPRPRRCTGSAMHRHCTFHPPSWKIATWWEGVAFWAALSNE